MKKVIMVLVIAVMIIGVAGIVNEADADGWGYNYNYNRYHHGNGNALEAVAVLGGIAIIGSIANEMIYNRRVYRPLPRVRYIQPAVYQQPIQRIPQFSQNTKCIKRTEKIWRNGKLIGDRITETCTSQKVNPLY